MSSVTRPKEKYFLILTQSFDSQAELPHGIELLCFPDSEQWTPKTLDPTRRIGRTYSLVLTDLNGRRKFGYCRRILPEGGNVALPLVYCVISSKRGYNLYNKVNTFATAEL